MNITKSNQGASALGFPRSNVFMWPLYFASIWMILPLVLMLFVPITLELQDPQIVIPYILFNVLCFAGGYRYFVVADFRKWIIPEQTKFIDSLVAKGFLFAILLLPVCISVYTGRSLLDIGSIMDQTAAYENLSKVFVEESLSRKVTSLIRGLAAPFTLGAIPIAAYFWPSLSRRTKILAVGTAATYALFSAFRGTDKEMGDLFILTISGLFARLARHHRMGDKFPKKKAFKYSLQLLAFVAVLVSLFVFRKSERLGGYVSFCLYGDVACFEPEGASEWGDTIGFGIAMLSSYLIQGYYGLSLALPLDYKWTFGIGHSQPLQTIFGFMVDTKTIYEQGLMAQLRTAGWDDRYVWSSIFPSLASDVGFAGVPIIFFIIGAVYARCWSFAISQDSRSAVVIFSLLSILVFYIPANNQIPQSFDLYFATIFWIIAFSFRKKNRVQK